MQTTGFRRDQRGSAVRWFAYAAAAITVTAAVGAHGMAWLVRTEREPLSAFLPLNRPSVASRSLGTPDMEATGSIRPAQPSAVKP